MVNPMVKKRQLSDPLFSPMEIVMHWKHNCYISIWASLHLLCSLLEFLVEVFHEYGDHMVRVVPLIQVPQVAGLQGLLVTTHYHTARNHNDHSGLVYYTIQQNMSNAISLTCGRLRYLVTNIGIWQSVSLRSKLIKEQAKKWVYKWIWYYHFGHICPTWDAWLLQIIHPASLNPCFMCKICVNAKWNP